jgi:hypothetical protein
VSMIHKRMVGDTGTPLNAKLSRAGNPIDLAGLTVKMQIEKDDGTSVLPETATGVTAHPTQNFTVDTTNDYILCNAHGAQDYEQVVVSSTGTIAPGLVVATRYFVRDAYANGYKVSSVPGGAAIDITGAGSGTHSFYIVGSVQYDFSTASVASAFTGRGWFTVYTGSEFDSLPTDGAGIMIEVLAYGN